MPLDPVSGPPGSGNWLRGVVLGMGLVTYGDMRALLVLLGCFHDAWEAGAWRSLAWSIVSLHWGPDVLPGLFVSSVCVSGIHSIRSIRFLCSHAAGSSSSVHGYCSAGWISYLTWWAVSAGFGTWHLGCWVGVWPWWVWNAQQSFLYFLWASSIGPAIVVLVGPVNFTHLPRPEQVDRSEPHHIPRCIRAQLWEARDT